MTPTATATPTPTPTDKPQIKTTRERMAAPGRTFDLTDYCVWVKYTGEHGSSLLPRKKGSERVDWAAARTVYASLTDPCLPPPGQHDRPYAIRVDLSLSAHPDSIGMKVAPRVHDGEVVHILSRKGRKLGAVQCRGEKFVKLSSG